MRKNATYAFFILIQIKFQEKLFKNLNHQKLMEFKKEGKNVKTVSGNSENPHFLKLEGMLGSNFD